MSGFFLSDLLISPVIQTLIRIIWSSGRLRYRKVQPQIQAFAKMKVPQTLAKLRAQLFGFLFILSAEQHCEFIAAYTPDQTVSIFVST